MWRMLICAVVTLWVLIAVAEEAAEKKPDGNWLAYLDEPLNPYYPHKDLPKLITPQWVGEEGVECVVTLGIDDMRDPKKYEAYLRPILDRLKQIDGRAPVSIMTCQVKRNDPQLQAWLEEGLSIECHTFDHPCPCLKESSLAKAKETYDKCVDLMSEIPGNKPVAFRMPCCDSLNTPSPRFWAEVFNKTTAKGNFLQIDSSVFNIITGQDESLPKEIRFNDAGEERFRRYVPFKDFVNTIEDYPYPYIIGRLCWEFPCVVPSDWSAQHVQKPNNPDTVRDWKLALDAIVQKQGVFNLVFHPHGWIRPEQVVELIDHAVEKHGKKVKFLTFKECAERLNSNLMSGAPIRDVQGRFGNACVFDFDPDGFIDVFVNAGEKRFSRHWNSTAINWDDHPLEALRDQEEKRRRDLLMEVDDKYFAGRMLGFSQRKDGTLGRIGWFEAAEHRWKRRWYKLTERRMPDHDQCSCFETPLERNFHFERDIDGDGTPEHIRICRDGTCLHRENEEGALRHMDWYPPNVKVIDDRGLDSGFRLIDVNNDNKLDCLFSNAERYSLHFFKDMNEGWSIKVIEGVRGQPGGVGPEIPPFVRADGTNNGAFFHSRALWIINEDTAKFPNHAFKLTFEEMLGKETKGQETGDQGKRP